MSDPFFRDQWLELWAGDCREVMDQFVEKSIHCAITSPPYFGLRSYLADDDEQKELEIGREATTAEYVNAMVVVARSIRRVLRDDGTFWLNIGDSYAAAAVGSFNGGGFKDKSARDGTRDLTGVAQSGGIDKAKASGLKPKDLIGIPWRVAFALQEDGWWLRNAIVWETPNPMPESVTDRLTNSYEMVFLLAKSPKYFFDQDAIREPHTEVTLNRIEYGLKHRHPEGIGVAIPPVDTDRMGERFAHPLGRNRRDVWSIPTHPYKGAHYAVFPKALIEPMIKAGTSEKGVCPECGAPWVRTYVKTDIERPDFKGSAFDQGKTGSRDGGDRTQPGARYVKLPSNWSPSCKHSDLAPVPAIVLDPFAGSGTVGVVAQDLSRRAVLIDLNPKYLKLQMERNMQSPLGLGA